MKIFPSICRSFLFLLIVFLCGAAADNRAWAEGPSFDCAKAKSPSEKYICEDEILKRQDFALAKVYQLALKADGKNADVVRKEQREWVKWRDGTCGQGLPESAKICLREIQARRIVELAKMAGLKPDAKLLAGLPKPSDDLGMYVLVADDDEVYTNTAGVCQAVEKNLNHFKREPPMVCEIRISPEETELSEPDWQPISPGPEAVDQYERMVRQRGRFVRDSLKGQGPPIIVLTNEFWEKRRPEVAKLLKDGIIRLHRAIFNVDGLPGDEEVIRCYEEVPPCGAHVWRIGSNDPHLQIVDQSDPLGFNHYFDDFCRDQLIPFFYNGRTYFQRWVSVQKIIDNSRPIGKGIRIGIAGRRDKNAKASNRPTPVCDFLYVHFNGEK